MIYDLFMAPSHRGCKIQACTYSVILNRSHSEMEKMSYININSVLRCKINEFRIVIDSN
jgi:hypothetical protein